MGDEFDLSDLVTAPAQVGQDEPSPEDDTGLDLSDIQPQQQPKTATPAVTSGSWYVPEADELPTWDNTIPAALQLRIAKSDNPTYNRDLMWTALAMNQTMKMPMSEALQKARALADSSDPQAKRINQAMPAEWTAQRITTRMNIIGARMLRSGETEEDLAEYKKLQAQLPGLEDVAPAYPETVLGWLEEKGRAALVGSAGLAGQQFERMAGASAYGEGADTSLKGAAERVVNLAREGAEMMVPWFLSGDKYVEQPGEIVRKLETAYSIMRGGKSMGEQEAGGSYMEMREAGVPREIALPIAQAVGTINQLTEWAGWATFVAMFPGADKVARDALSTLTRKAIVGPLLKNKALQLAAKYAGSVAGNMGQEVAQEVTTWLGTELGKEMHDKVLGLPASSLPPEMQAWVNKEVLGETVLSDRLAAMTEQFLPAMMLTGALPVAATVTSNIAQRSAQAVAPGITQESVTGAPKVSEVQTIRDKIAASQTEIQDILRAQEEADTEAAVAPDLSAPLAKLEEHASTVQTALDARIAAIDSSPEISADQVNEILDLAEMKDEVVAAQQRYGVRSQEQTLPTAPQVPAAPFGADIREAIRANLPQFTERETTAAGLVVDFRAKREGKSTADYVAQTFAPGVFASREQAEATVAQQPGANAAVQFLEDGRAIIHAVEQTDFKALVHEFVHVFGRHLSEEESAKVQATFGTGVQAEERFSEAMIRFYQTGETEHTEMRPLMGELAELLRGARTQYADLIPEETRKVFDSVLGAQTTQGAEASVEAETDTLFNVGDRDAFYLKSARTVEEKMKGPMQASALRSMLANAGVKPDELKWTGLDEFLAEDRKLTPAEVQQYLAENAVTLVEVEKGKPGMGLEAGETKFEGYVLPGGENYRELLITVPELGARKTSAVTTLPEGMSTKKLSPDSYQAKEGRPWAVVRADGSLVGNAGATQERAIANALETIAASAKWEARPVSYSSPHWGEENVLVHMRFDERTDAEGKRVLFVEEIQSDWHQAGREKGYSTDTPPRVAGIESKVGSNLPPGWYWPIDESGKHVTFEALYGPSEEEAIAKAQAFVDDKFRSARVPSAPFSKTWPELAFKRMLRWAAENGFDSVAWTTGEQQAARYDLSKQIARLDAGKQEDGAWALQARTEEGTVVLEKEDIPENQLSDIVGKEMAQRIVERGGGAFEGLDLKVGGEGMKGFYDKMLVDFANKYGKKWGAAVGDTSLDAATVHSLPITPEMRESVMRGQTLFNTQEDQESAYESARTFSDPEEYVAFEQAMSLEPKPEEEIRKEWETAQTAAPSRARENARFLASIETPEGIDALLLELWEAEGDQPKLPTMDVHNLFKAAVDKAPKGISDAHRAKLLAQLRDNPTKYRAVIAQVLGDEAAADQIAREQETDPDAAAIEQAKEANRELRRQNALLTKKIGEIEKLASRQELGTLREQLRADVATMKAKEIAERAGAEQITAKATTRDLLAQIAEEQAAQEATVKQAETALAQAEREGKKAVIAARREERDKAAAKLATTKEKAAATLAAQKQRMKDYREAVQTKAHADRLIKSIMRKPGKGMTVAKAREVRAMQDRLVVKDITAHQQLRDKLQAWKNANPGKALPAEAQRIIDQRLVRDMTVEELEAYQKEVNDLRTAGRQALGRKKYERMRQKEALWNDVLPVLSSVKPKKTLPTGTGSESYATAVETGKLALLDLINTRPNRLAEILDGGQPNGPNSRLLVGAVNAAEDEKVVNVLRRKMQIPAKMKELGLKPRDFFRLVKVGEDVYNKNQALAVYIYMQNEDTKRHLMGETGINDRSAAILIGSLSPKQKQMGDFLMSLFEGKDKDRFLDFCVEYLNSDTEEVKKYFPTVVQGALYEKHEEQILDDIAGRSGIRRGRVNKGSSISRVKSTKKISLNAFAIALDAIEKHEHLLAYQEVVENMNYVYTRPTVLREIVRAHGEDMARIVKQYIADVANPKHSHEWDPVIKLSERIRGNVTVSGIAWNLTSYARNWPTFAKWLYLPYANAGRLYSAQAQWLFGSRKLYDFVTSHDPQIADRVAHPEFEEMHLRQWNKTKRFADRANMLGVWALEQFDLGTALIGWKGVYDHVYATTEGDAATKEAAATAAAKDATLRTQPQGKTKDLTSIQKSPTGKWLVLFGNQLNQMYNMLWHDLPTAMKNRELAALKKVMWAVRLGGAFAITGIIMGAIDRKRLPKDEKEIAEDIVSQFLAPSPFVGDVLVSTVAGKPAYGSTLYGSTLKAPIAETIQRGAKIVKEAQEGDTEGLLKAAINAAPSALRLLGFGGAVPVQRIIRAFTEGDAWWLIGGPPEDRED
jgi:hypothetical protein